MPRFMPVGTPQSINQQKPRIPKPPMSSGPPHTMGVGGSGAQGDVKFITVNGRVIPIRQKPGAGGGGGGGGMSLGKKIGIGESYLGDTLAANKIGAGIMAQKAKNKILDIGSTVGSNIQGAKIGIQRAMGKTRPSVFQNIGKVGPEIPQMAPLKPGYISPSVRANIKAGAALAPIKTRASRIKVSEGELVIPISTFSLSEIFDEDQISQILAEIQAEVGEFDSYELTEEGLRFGEYLIAHEDLVRIGIALMES